jgi:hypothetical protein
MDQKDAPGSACAGTAEAVKKKITAAQNIFFLRVAFIFHLGEKGTDTRHGFRRFFPTL